jgi:hypothetical protein
VGGERNIASALALVFGTKHFARGSAPVTRLMIQHETRYRYEKPVSFGPQRLMLRPRDSHGLKVEKASLAVSPPAPRTPSGALTTRSALAPGTRDTKSDRTPLALAATGLACAGRRVNVG